MRLRGRIYNAPRLYLLRFEIFDTNHCSFTGRASTCIEFLGFVLVLLLPTEVRFTYSNRCLELFSVIISTLTNSISKIPCRFLCYIQIAMNLHTGHTLDPSTENINRLCPNPITQFGILRNDSNTNAEKIVTFFVTETVVHYGVGNPNLHIFALTVRTSVGSLPPRCSTNQACTVRMCQETSSRV